MNQYDVNVTKVMNFLIENNYSASSRSLHKICYESFNTYLETNKLMYSFENVNKWLESNQNDWSYRRYTGYKHCLEQLEDIFQNSHISLAHLAPQLSDYSILCAVLKVEIDEYLDYALKNGVKESDISRRRIACSRFMIYLQNHDVSLTP